MDGNFCVSTVAAAVVKHYPKFALDGLPGSATTSNRRLSPQLKKYSPNRASTLSTLPRLSSGVSVETVSSVISSGIHYCQSNLVTGRQKNGPISKQTSVRIGITTGTQLRRT